MFKTDWLIQNEASIRVSIYFSVLIFMGVWEHYSRALPIKNPKAIRWINNISLAWLGGLSVRLFIPATALGVATFCHNNSIGLLHKSPFWLNILLTLLLLDCLIYWQHRLFHKIPILWRVHSTHHLDPEVDASTGARFHPIEILLSMLIKLVCITALGCSPIAVLLFEILLNASATFNHSNINLPHKINLILKTCIVTPSIHRIHHSTKPSETHSNFGFFLIIWDKLFKTYTEEMKSTDSKTILGLPDVPERLNKQTLVALLMFPFYYKR